MLLISPLNVIRGKNAWASAVKEISNISQSPLILGRSAHTKEIRSKIYDDLKRIQLNPYRENLEFDCCIEDIERIYNIATKQESDSIIAVGGGKVLDAGKYFRNIYQFPV